MEITDKQANRSYQTSTKVTNTLRSRPFIKNSKDLLS